MIRILVDPERPDCASIERAASVIRLGGVAAIPTDTLYGLAADPGNVEAVRRVFAIKGRSATQGLPLVAADIPQVEQWFGVLPVMGIRLGSRFWPGALTLLVSAPSRLVSEVTGGLPTVGVRVPGHAVTRALCAACGFPLTATSANFSGEPATSDPDAVIRALGDAVDVTVDAGRSPGGLASTIVDVTSSAPRLVRAGAISWDEIQACVQAP